MKQPAIILSNSYLRLLAKKWPSAVAEIRFLRQALRARELPPDPNGIKWRGKALADWDRLARSCGCASALSAMRLILQGQQTGAFEERLLRAFTHLKHKTE